MSFFMAVSIIRAPAHPQEKLRDDKRACAPYR
jgi:hypothetical protein